MGFIMVFWSHILEDSFSRAIAQIVKTTVDPESFARILFLGIELKDIFATFKLCD